MSILVVTPTLGRSPYLDAAVDSVAAVRSRVRHVMVAPANVVDGLRQRFQTVEILAEEGRGLYVAIEQAVRRGEGMRGFTWLNDDDVLVPAGFEALASLFEADTSIDLLHGRVGWIDREGIRRGGIPVCARPADWLWLLQRRIVPVAQPGTVVSLEIFRKIGGFDPALPLCGDLDLFMRVSAAGGRVGFVSDEVAGFRIHAGQLSKREEQVGRETDAIRRRLAWAGWWGAWCARLRFFADNAQVYRQRLRTQGFVSMRKVYRHE